MKRKIVSILAMIMLLGALFSGGALAKNDHDKKSLVALGDSITTGYNLENNNNHVSKDAFPALIGDEMGWRVRNLGVPGATTKDLLKSLQTEKYREAIKHADYITLNIGSNDLLRAYSETGGDVIALQPKVESLFERLGLIIQTIKYLNPEADIVLYNIYNAFQKDNPMHNASNILLSNWINPKIELTTQIFGVGYVDAFSEFSGKQAQYLLPSPDIHPNTKGQMVLGKIGSEAFLHMNMVTSK